MSPRNKASRLLHPPTSLLLPHISSSYSFLILLFPLYTSSVFTFFINNPITITIAAAA